jgi:endoglucanase
VAGLAFVAARYARDPLVVGLDLRNELRPATFPAESAAASRVRRVPTWGSGDALTDWAAAAERGGAAALAANPNLLIVVEGLDYSLDFSGVAEGPPAAAVSGALGPPHGAAAQTAGRPIVLPIPNKLVYSPHSYAWSYPKARSYDEWRASVERGSGFLHTRGATAGSSGKASTPVHVAAAAAPVWLGEFGTDRRDAHWDWVTRYLNESTIAGFAYWPLNGEDPWGVLNEDYQTVRHPWKLRDLGLVPPARPPTPRGDAPENQGMQNGAQRSEL